MWQHLGYNPHPAKQGDKKRKSSDFYKGAFDTIPFLNQDAKRTFQHLLLRPGYMIRDYIQGEHEKYLAPLTALIVFYAFFALVSSVLQPIQHKNESAFDFTKKVLQDTTFRESGVAIPVSVRITEIIHDGYLYLHLDQHPEAVQTRHQAALAALETTLRSQGIPLFLSEFLFLWLAMCLTLRRFQISKSACAAAAAYVLCQFCFFMLFAVLLTWGESTSINVFLMLFLLTVDYHQWLELPWKKSLRRALLTGINYGVILAMAIVLVGVVVFFLALLKINLT